MVLGYVLWLGTAFRRRLDYEDERRHDRRFRPDCIPKLAYWQWARRDLNTNSEEASLVLHEQRLRLMVMEVKEG